MAGTAAASAPVVHRPRGVVRTSVALTCDSADGLVPSTVVGVGFGKLVGVLYDGGLDASAVIEVRDTKTGAIIISYTTGTEAAPVFFRPTDVVVKVDGDDVVITSDVAPNVNRDIFLAGKVSIAVTTTGGNSETGLLALIVDESQLGDLALTV